MIRGVVVHLLNEQPVLVDLLDMPKTSDVGLVCTNIRTLDGRKPIFVDQGESTFFFPYLNIRFIEILPDREAAADAVDASPAAAPEPGADDEDLEIDEDFLRRIREA